MKWWIQLLPDVAPRIVKPIGSTVYVRICSDACAADGGLAGVALFSNRGDEFSVLPRSGADGELIEGLADGISGSEMFSIGAAVIALGEQPRERRAVLFPDNNAAAGP